VKHHPCDVNLSYLWNDGKKQVLINVIL
jgi:predicted heme/steroid binding protein